MLSFPEKRKRNSNKSLNNKRKRGEEMRRHTYMFRIREEKRMVEERKTENIKRKMKIWDEERENYRGREKKICAHLF